MIITIEGNVGSGKSTLLPQLAEAMGFQYADEEVDVDPTFKALMNQSATDGALSRYMAHKAKTRIQKAYQQGGDWLIERSPASSMLFALAEDADDETIRHITQTVISTPPIQLHVYIRTKPNVCMKRIKERDRDCERGVYTMKNLKRLHEILDNWASAGESLYKVLIIDDDEMSIEDMARLIKTHVETVTQLSQQFDQGLIRH